MFKQVTVHILWSIIVQVALYKKLFWDMFSFLIIVMHVSFSIMDWIPCYLGADSGMCSNMWVLHCNGCKSHEIYHGIFTFINVYKGLTATKQMFYSVVKVEDWSLFALYDYVQKEGSNAKSGNLWLHQCVIGGSLYNIVGNIHIR
jgi:hypothetical protein